MFLGLYIFLFFYPHKVILRVLLTIIYIISHFLFQKYNSKSTLFWYCNLRCSSRKYKQEIIVCFVCCIATLIWLHCYIFLNNLFYFINFFLEHNLYWFLRYCRKEGKFVFCFGTELVSTIRLFMFFICIKSLYESYLPLY